MHKERRIPVEQANKSGLCMCGCGEKTAIATFEHRDRGIFKGKPLRFLPGHSAKLRTGAKSHLWKGGRFTSTDGYIHISAPEHPHRDKDGYVFEHRLVMEKKLGRLLDRKERVHHINGIKNDNRPENLVALTSQGVHVLIHNPIGNWRRKNPEEWRKQRSAAGKKGAEARWSKVD